MILLSYKKYIYLETFKSIEDVEGIDMSIFNKERVHYLVRCGYRMKTGVAITPDKQHGIVFINEDGLCSGSSFENEIGFHSDYDVVDGMFTDIIIRKEQYDFEGYDLMYVQLIKMVKYDEENNRKADLYQAKIEKSYVFIDDSPKDDRLGY